MTDGHGDDDPPIGPTGVPGSQGTEGGEQDGEGRRPDSLARSLLEWVLVIVGALVVAMVLRAVLFQAFWIPSESMEPTLQRNDRVLVNRLSYRVGDVGRGDVVVFDRPPGQPDNGIDELIKRVIGVEGDTIEGRNGRILVNGVAQDEDYLASGTFFGDFGPVVVPEDHVFVMGDNRDNSVDSRIFGPIDEDSIVGRAFVLFWPLNRLRWL